MNKIFIIIIVILLSIICFSPAIENNSHAENNRIYEIDAASVGEYKTDAARAIEAYERLMDKYMSLNEAYLSNMTKEISALTAKADGLNQQLLQISEKLDRIEKSVNCRPLPPPIPSQRTEPQISEPSR